MHPFSRSAPPPASEAKAKAKGQTASRGEREVAVEERYQRKTPREHILLRPEPYVGSMQRTTEEQWLYDAASDGMVYRTCTFVPALYHILDELLVNASDNKHRSPPMTCIKVSPVHPRGHSTTVHTTGVYVDTNSQATHLLLH